MKPAQHGVQCQGYCEYYWNGRQWTLVLSTCSAGCGCQGPPVPPPPNTPPFTYFEQCVPKQEARKQAAKFKRTCVQIHVSPELDVCLEHVSKLARKRGK